MKASIKIILLVSLSASIGLGIGYLLFGKPTIATTEHSHSTTSNSPEVEEVWTCSMHPNVRQAEPGDCPICGMALSLLPENNSSDPLVLEMTPQAVQLANIQTTPVDSKNGSSGKSLRLSGKIQVDERLASSQVAHVPGRIEKLLVTFTGEQVLQGQQLALLYSPELLEAQGELLEALKIADLQPQLVEAARKKLRYWKISEAQIAAIEESGIIQERFPIFANQSGVVLHKKVAVGDYVQKGQILFDFIDLKKVWVLFDAYEKDLASIKIGDPITFSTPALPKQNFQTRITFIDPIIDPQTRVATVRAELKNNKGLLKPEMLVYGNLQKKTTFKDQLLVPKSAVLWTGPRSVVYVKVPDRTIPSFQFREVEIGETWGDAYLVSSGLELGEEVVTYGSFTIDAAAQLNNQASMMNKKVLVKGASTTVVRDYSSTTPSAFQAQLFRVAKSYLFLKEALVISDSTLVNEMAQKVLQDLTQLELSLLTDEARAYAQQQFSALQTHGKKIKALKGLAQQRQEFDYFSQALIAMLQAFGTPEGARLYVQYCPMSFDNTGASWISDASNIRNPYFGDRMLTCGKVEWIIGGEEH